MSSICRASICALLPLFIFVVDPASARSPVDGTYPGVLTLKVDLTDSPRKIFVVRETIPVAPGALRLTFPKWIPGEHGPTGPIDGVTGLKISANGQRLAWRRDLEDMYLLHLEIPAGVSNLDLDFQFLSSAGGNFGAGISATPRMVVLEWNQVLFYPADYATDRINIAPSIKVPVGWSLATALEKTTAGTEGTGFKSVSVTELVDSPLMAGLHFKRIDLAPGAALPVHLNIVADRADNLQLTELQIKHHQTLVKQAVALFGAQHYDRYEFLLALSERTAHFGLEHHQSSDNRTSAEFFTMPEFYLAGPTLLPHEYVHSWNGKFRRPTGLTTANYSAPMKGELLWVYEGLTNYLGEVLAARSGMWTAEQYRDAMAINAADMDHRPGRAWRPLRDTADNAQVLYNVPGAWANYRRSVDFYPEGSLLWLDVDTRLRELSGGTKSLDDFTRSFHGNDAAFARTSHDVKPYDFDDVVKALNAVQRADWAAFLRTRLDSTDVRAPLDGISRGGWKLAFTDEPTELFKARKKQNKQLNVVQHIKTLLQIHGRAAVVVPDNVLFEGGAGETIRRKLLHECEVHTLLRLPTGLFYAQGVKANVIFFDRKPANETPWTRKLWIYDLRTNKHFTLKTNPMKREDLEEFVALYNPANRHKRKATWSAENPEGRWRVYEYEELIARDKASLDIFWLKDDSLADSDNLPTPEIIAQEIVDDLEAALEQFRLIAGDLGVNAIDEEKSP